MDIPIPSASNMSLFPTVSFLLLLVGYGACCEEAEPRPCCQVGDFEEVSNLPEDILENYFCNSLSAGDPGPRFKRSAHPITKRQTSSLQQLKDKFGNAKVTMLQDTLRIFFNQNLEDYATEMLAVKTFYWAEMKVLRKALGNVSNVNQVITAIKRLRVIDDLGSALKTYAEEGDRLVLCNEVYRAYQADGNGQASCGGSRAYGVIGDYCAA